MVLNFTVSGMTCAACSARVEKVVSEIPGVLKAEVNLLAGKLTVDAQRENIADEIIKTANEGDIVITMGGGDIYKAAYIVKEKLG